MKLEELSLENAGDGALEEAFNNALAEILQDFDRPGKNPADPREINLKVVLQQEDDMTVSVTVSGNAKLPKPRAIKTRAIREGDGLKQIMDTQQELPFATVTPIKKEMTND